MLFILFFVNALRAASLSLSFFSLIDLITFDVEIISFKFKTSDTFLLSN